MEDPANLIAASVAESLRIKSVFFEEYRDRIVGVARRIAEGFRGGHTVLFFGNGGSAADAQHLAAEFVGRFVPDRPALPALSLSADTSVLTALGNDYGYENVFARQISALGRPGDTAVAISTSGNSPNVLAAIEVARATGLYTVGFTGESGGQMADRVEALFRVPTRKTPRIQETHILLGHIICELVDRYLFPDVYPRD